MSRRGFGPIRTPDRQPGSGRPWILAFAASGSIHLVLGLLVAYLAVGAFVVRAPGTRSASLVSAEFFERSLRPPLPPTPPKSSAESDEDPSESRAREIAQLAQMEKRLEQRLERPIAESEELAKRLGERLAAPLPGLALSPLGADKSASVAFVGLQAEAVESVVYVVDASGSLVGSLPIVIDELERSLSRLAATQRFSIVFFQRNGALALPPEGALRGATPESVREAISWARRTVRPQGRSNPVAALATALALRPDVVFVLSADITGSGEFEVSRDDLLAALERLNPADDGGARRSRIQCIEFLDPDPQAVLRSIAERHGGTSGFRYLSREELGLVAPRR